MHSLESKNLIPWKHLCKNSNIADLPTHFLQVCHVSALQIKEIFSPEKPKTFQDCELLSPILCIMLHQGELVACASTDCDVLTFINKVEKTSIWISDPWFSALADREKNPSTHQVGKFTLKLKSNLQHRLSDSCSIINLHLKTVIKDFEAHSSCLRGLLASWYPDEWSGTEEMFITQFRDSLLWFHTDEHKHKDRKLRSLFTWY